ncbi:transcription elongation factor GreA [Saccharopolyspora rosea]|uniref:Transcription elongation factor GreA n=1 Tax=Saccharopolyspora rosea TaxID=524884 RepID=A0ABW3FZ72_9PSEU|nr:transcription elongation factor GreA [Saccharopolyspora rosea]
MEDTRATWFSAEAYERLRRELDELIARRPAVAAEIDRARREGDPRENSGYQVAVEEQEMQEARIRELRALLRDARTGPAPRHADVAEPGTLLTLRFADGETETFLLASHEESAPGAADVVSTRSPLGTALLGARVGEEREYDLPGGEHMRVEVTKIEPYQG